MKDICGTCGNHDEKEKTWMMFPGSVVFTSISFHVAHTILEKAPPPPFFFVLVVLIRKC